MVTMSQKSSLPQVAIFVSQVLIPDTLQKELSQPTASKGTRMRLVIDKQPEGTRSPNLADAVVMAYWPVVNTLYDSSMEWV
jgi:phage terminase large subunit